MKSLFILACFLSWSSWGWCQADTAATPKYWAPEQQVEAVLAMIPDSGKREELRRLFTVTEGNLIAPIMKARHQVLASNIPGAQALALMRSGGDLELAKRVHWNLDDMRDVFQVIAMNGIKTPEVESERSGILVAQCELIVIPICKTLKISPQSKPYLLTSEGLKGWLASMVVMSLSSGQWDAASLETLRKLRVLLQTDFRKDASGAYVQAPRSIFNLWSLLGVATVVICACVLRVRFPVRD